MKKISASLIIVLVLLSLTGCYVAPQTPVLSPTPTYGTYPTAAYPTVSPVGYYNNGYTNGGGFTGSYVPGTNGYAGRTGTNINNPYVYGYNGYDYKTANSMLGVKGTPVNAADRYLLPGA